MTPRHGRDAEAWCARSAAEDDYTAVIGDNRKLVVFPLTELAELDARIRGCSCSAIATAGCPTRSASASRTGLELGGWAANTGRTRTEADLDPVARRARGGRADAAGRLPAG
jgi:topoisomerase-4 subunit A